MIKTKTIPVKEFFKEKGISNNEYIKKSIEIVIYDGSIFFTSPIKGSDQMGAFVIKNNGDKIISYLEAHKNYHFYLTYNDKIDLDIFNKLYNWLILNDYDVTIKEQVWDAPYCREL